MSGSVAKDIAGYKFGKLTVIERVENHITSGGHSFPCWLCICECGTKVVVLTTRLNRGRTVSCGCQRLVSRKTHGHASNGIRSKTYGSWIDMWSRCTNPNVKAYYRYGGRGITVCKRWRKFENFLADMGERPLHMTLDRINNDKGYSKRNCRWATYKQQANNRSKKK